MLNPFKKKCGKRGLDLVKKWEGCERKLPNGKFIAYLDTNVRPVFRSPGYKGLWTIGYGSTGPNVTEGTIWTQAKCDSELLKEINKFADALNKYLKVKVNQNQFDALCSAAYNLGINGMHTVLDAINDGNNELAMQRLLIHNRAGGRVLKGLTRRRLEEKELFEWETPKQIASLSTPMKIAQHGQRATILGGITLASMWEFLGQAKQIAVDNAGWILLGSGVLAFSILKLWEYHTQKSFDDGTYVPEGTIPVDPELQ